VERGFIRRRAVGRPVGGEGSFKRRGDLIDFSNEL